MKKVFIDGSVGTTGLRIADRLADREDLTIIRLPESLRKDPIARKEAINNADIVFLCLPDGAAMEAVSLVENPNVKIIDTSPRACYCGIDFKANLYDITLRYRKT